MSADKKTPGVASATKDQVGVKATDNYTLDVKLENPTPYFLSLMAFQTYMPVRQDVIEAHPNDWAVNAATYISNGPFTLKKWLPKERFELVKNKYYWNKDKVKLEKLNLSVYDDVTSYMSAYQTGQIDIIDTPPVQQTTSLLKQGKAKTYPTLGVEYYAFNLDIAKATKISPNAAKVMQNVNVRKAISLAIDRTSLVKDITKSGENPATSFVPKGIVGPDGKDFKQKNYYKSTADLTQAKKLLSDAGYPEGRGFPDLELLYNSAEKNQNVAEAVQNMIKKNLNINVVLRAVERKVQLSNTTIHDYVFSRNGWTADYSDPMTFLDMWTTTSGNNIAGYSNKDYDKLIADAKLETNVTKRFTELHQAQDILLKDMPVVPLYERTVVVCTKDYVKGVYRTPMDQVYFVNAYVQK